MPLSGDHEVGDPEFVEWSNLVDTTIGETQAAITTEATARVDGDNAAVTTAQNYSVQRANHTGMQSADTLTDGTTNKAFLATERTKLAGIATGATANSSDATLLARANHTGTQLAATISDFNSAAVTATTGTYQPVDPDLTTIAGLDSTTAGALVTDGSGWIRKTYAQLKTALSLVKGDVGLGNVDNTADTAKPVSTAQQTALDLKAPLTESVNTVAATGSTETLPDVTTATIHRLTLDANCTLTFPTAAAGKSFTLVLIQDATGSRTVTWPGTVKWAGGTAPTLTTTAAKKDVFSFLCADGTNWLGFTSGQNFS